jgi:hypothetical protein
LLHVIANRDIPGLLAGYYAFPFLAACAWPLAAVVIDARQRRVAPDRRTALAGFGVMLALSFVGLSEAWNPGRIDLWRNFLTWPERARAQATEMAVRTLIAATAAARPSPFGALVIDQSVYSFAPYDFAVTCVIGRADDRPATVTGPVDTIAYFSTGFDRERVQGIIATARLTHAYRFTGTAILLASNRPLDGVAGLEAAPDTPP